MMSDQIKSEMENQFPSRSLPRTNQSFITDFTKPDQLYYVTSVGSFETDYFSTRNDDVTVNATPADESESGVKSHHSSPLLGFSEWYEGVHGYVSLAVCIFGIAANIMNIVVLTRKGMVTPTNSILTAIATADLMTMLSYLPYAVYFHCVSSPDPNNEHSQAWIIYLIFHTNFIITSHTIAMWLAVALAVFRYIVVCHHLLGPQLCSLKRAKIAISLVYIVTILFCLSNYVMYRPQQRPTGGYWFDVNDFVTDFHKAFTKWLFGVVLKVAPCTLLTVLSALLVRAMRDARRRRSNLKAVSRRSTLDSKAADKDRTTFMLVLVVLSFVVTELPQGILAFLSGVDNDIFDNVYVPLGDVFDILVLVNSSVNFILYCVMSAQYRKTFRDVFCRICARRRNKAATNAARFLSTATPAPVNLTTTTTC